jgi:hypothetical protein
MVQKRISVQVRVEVKVEPEDCTATSALGVNVHTAKQERIFLLLPAISPAKQCSPLFVLPLHLAHLLAYVLILCLYHFAR